MPFTNRAIRSAAFLLPYISVAIGLYALKSAWASIALYHAGMLTFLWAWRPPELRQHLSRGFRAGPGIPLLLGCAASGLLVYQLWPFLGPSPAQLALDLQTYGFSRQSLLGFVIYFGIVHAPLEEVYWRSLTREDTGVLSASDLAFAGYHAFVIVLFLPAVFALLAVLLLTGVSALWRYQARRFGGYALPLLSHALADLSILAAIYCLADF